MASVNWQRLWCYLGFHVEKWVVETVRKKLTIDAQPDSQTVGKMLFETTFRPSQDRVCTNCGLISRRQIGGIDETR